MEGQGQFLTLAQGHLYRKLKTSFSQKPLGHFYPNFICKLSGRRKWKFIDMMLVTWPRWLPCPYMVKTLQKSSTPEPLDRFPRNLVCSIDDSCHRSLFKWWPWVDLDLFYGKVKFGNLGFSMGKSENCWFFRIIAACNLKLHEIMKICEYWRSDKIISWPWPKVNYIWNLKLTFLRNHWANQSQILYVSFQVQGNENLSTWCWSHDQDGCHAHVW